jgi:hypothetical protein
MPFPYSCPTRSGRSTLNRSGAHRTATPDSSPVRIKPKARESRIIRRRSLNTQVVLHQLRCRQRTGADPRSARKRSQQGRGPSGHRGGNSRRSYALCGEPLSRPRQSCGRLPVRRAGGFEGGGWISAASVRTKGIEGTGLRHFVPARLENLGALWSRDLGYASGNPWGRATSAS